MGLLKGQLEYKKWEKGEKLTRKQALLSHCYQCNGKEDSSTNCLGEKTCPLYDFSPYKGA